MLPPRCQVWAVPLVQGVGPLLCWSFVRAALCCPLGAGCGRPPWCRVRSRVIIHAPRARCLFFPPRCWVMVARLGQSAGLLHRTSQIRAALVASQALGVGGPPGAGCGPTPLQLTCVRCLLLPPRCWVWAALLVQGVTLFHCRSRMRAAFRCPPGAGSGRSPWCRVWARFFAAHVCTLSFVAPQVMGVGGPPSAGAGQCQRTPRALYFFVCVWGEVLGLGGLPGAGCGLASLLRFAAPRFWLWAVPVLQGAGRVLCSSRVCAVFYYPPRCKVRAVPSCRMRTHVIVHHARAVF